MTRKSIAAKKRKSKAAARIRKLRSQLGLSQSDFATEVDATRIAVGAWEAGDYEPSSTACVQIAKLAKKKGDKKASAWFMEAGLHRAGFNPDDVTQILVPELEDRISAANSPRGEIVAVPILRSATYIGQPTLAPETEIVERLPIAATLVSNPAFTSAFYLPSYGNRGPFRGGEVIVVDSRDREPANGQVVAVANRPTKRPDQPSPSPNAFGGPGVRVGWFYTHVGPDRSYSAIFDVPIPYADLPSFWLAKRLLEEIEIGNPDVPDRLRRIAKSLAGRWRPGEIDLQSGAAQVLGRVICWMGIRDPKAFAEGLRAARQESAERLSRISEHEGER